MTSNAVSLASAGVPGEGSMSRLPNSLAPIRFTAKLAAVLG